MRAPVRIAWERGRPARNVLMAGGTAALPPRFDCDHG